MSASTAAAGGDEGPDIYVRLTEAERRVTAAALCLCASNIEGRIALMQIAPDDVKDKAVATLQVDLREVRRMLAKVSE